MSLVERRQIGVVILSGIIYVLNGDGVWMQTDRIKLGYNALDREAFAGLLEETARGLRAMGEPVEPGPEAAKGEN